MRRAARVDDNQPEIVAKFRELGWSVAHTHTLGGGMTDIIVGRDGENVLVEIKDGSKPPSARQLTPDEVKFHREWKGRIDIVETVDDVVEWYS